MIERIINHYNKNKNYYENIIKSVNKNIDGRVPHNKIIILTVICDILNIKNYLEIGVHNGASMSYVLSSKNKINCVGIDLFEDTIKQYKNDKLLQLRTEENVKNNNLNNGEIKLIKGNSFDSQTVDKVNNIFVNDDVDLLFIDGDHSYNGISSDFKNYTNFVKNHGVIVIDDYNKRHKEIKNFCDREIDRRLFDFLGVFQDNELILLKK